MIFQGIRTSIAKKPYILWFFMDPLFPHLDPPTVLSLYFQTLFSVSMLIVRWIHHGQTGPRSYESSLQDVISIFPPPGQVWYLIVSIPDLCLPLSSWQDFIGISFLIYGRLMLSYLLSYLSLSCPYYLATSCNTNYFDDAWRNNSMLTVFKTMKVY